MSLFTLLIALFHSRRHQPVFLGIVAPPSTPHFQVFLWAHSLANTHLQSCLLSFPTSFSLLFDPLLDDDLLKLDQVVDVIFNSMI